MSPDEFTHSACWSGLPVARKIAEAIPRCRVVVTATICDAKAVDFHGSTSYVCLLDDGTGEIGLLFLGRRRVPGLVVGSRCTVEGTARMGDRRLMVWNPFYSIEPDDSRGEPTRERPPTWAIRGRLPTRRGRTKA
jgi:hypothetical protein